MDGAGVQWLRAGIVIYLRWYMAMGFGFWANSARGTEVVQAWGKKEAAGGGAGRRGHGVMEVQTHSRSESRGGARRTSNAGIFCLGGLSASIGRKVQLVMVRAYLQPDRARARA
jgi:hypothetical protein